MNLNEKIETGFAKIFDHAEKRNNMEEDCLRASRLPFCPLRVCYEELLGLPGDWSKIFLENHYYMELGTVTHELIQDYVIKHMDAFEIIGKNPQEGNTELYMYDAGDEKYEEVEASLPFLTGHVDGLYKVPDTNQVCIIDYKTTGGMMVRKHKSKNPTTKSQSGLPKNMNRWQIRSYGLMLEPVLKEYDLELAGMFLIYISRDYPCEFVVVEVEQADWDLREHIRVMNEGYVKLKQAIQSNEFNQDLVEFCKERAICETPEFYETQVHDSVSACPVAKRGLCWNFPKLDATLEDALEMWQDRQEV